uniref:Uncharacterized protein n=1 Tax=Anguilla anguilla TaxID=7936 RepID=A0A0E9SSH1_ANGAN
MLRLKTCKSYRCLLKVWDIHDLWLSWKSKYQFYISHSGLLHFSLNRQQLHHTNDFWNPFIDFTYY